jgi:hypothetical protein
MIREAFREESTSCTKVLEWHARFRAHQKEDREEKSKVKSMVIILFDIKGIVLSMRYFSI